jgi:pyruvate kinase
MIKNIKQVSNTIGIMFDTKGPEIRTGLVKEKTILKTGQSFILTTRPIIGDSTQVNISYKRFPKQAKKGHVVLINDGAIELKVDHVLNRDVICKVKSGGVLKNNRGINLPGQKVVLPSLTDKDKMDLRFAMRNHADFIAVSFVKTADDILKIKQLIKSQPHIKIIAKIECEEAVKNFYKILEVADGIMVARGDMGVELPPEDVPLIQKHIIEKCNEIGKPVITATQMLESMTENNRPTRAEASDVANAILDGTDAIMLSGETAIGKYPIAAVKMMTRISKKVELNLDLDHNQKLTSTNDAIAKAVYDITQITPINKILVCTYSGYSASLISKFRPEADIVAMTPDEKTTRQLALVWGAQPVDINKGREHKITTTRDLIYWSTLCAYKNKLIKKSDRVIITAAHPLNVRKRTNLIEIHRVGELIGNKGKNKCI